MTLTALEDFKIGDRTVRPSLGVIVNGDDSVRVEPRSIEVLQALAERRGELYPKKELIHAVWGDTFVSDEVLTHAIWELRKAFGDSASKPRFIQTIPKRGYRIIAPVEAVEPPAPTEETHSEADGVSSWERRLLWGGLGAVLVFMAVMAVLGGLPAAEEPPPTLKPLAIVASRAQVDDAALSERLAEDLYTRLTGTEGLRLSRPDACPERAPGTGDYCLEVRVTGAADSNRTWIKLLENGVPVFAPPEPTQSPGVDSTEDLAEQVDAYFVMIDMPFFKDSDFQAWIDLRRDDVRAVVRFLKAMELVYTNEVGGRKPLDLAIQIDPDFIAPRVMRIPWLATTGDFEAANRHLDHLATLGTDATNFEQAMIEFARAHTRAREELAAGGNPSRSEEIRWLESALDSEKQNRPVTYILGSILLETGQLEESCATLAPLVESRWYYPPVYSDSASCNILLGQIEEARVARETAQTLSTVDAQLLLLGLLLAIYDGDSENQSLYREQLAARIREIEPERFEYDSSAHQETLARLAEEAGRNDIAQKLREFSY